MGLFLDIIHLSAEATDAALEGMYKAYTSGHDHDGDDAFLPHDSPFLQRLIELFSKRGLDRLEHVKGDLLAWQLGHKHKPSAVPVQSPGMIHRWSDDEVALARLYLESLPPSAWSIDDHMMAVDLVVQTNMPPHVMQSEAAWFTARAAIMGKVQANLEKPPTLAQADTILAALPLSLDEAGHQFGLPAAQRAALDFARVRCAENVRALTEDVRHRLRHVVAQDMELRAAGTPPPGTSSLQTKLTDAFGTLNRDWRRIAITEAGEAQLLGFITSLPHGTKVKRVEQYRNACAFCRKIDGKVMTIVDAAKPDKDPETEIWQGKTNVGRSVSPRKRVGDLLVEREPHERWQIPIGLAHPNCRGRWVRVMEDAPGDDADFAAFLRATLAPSSGGTPGA